MKNLHKYRFFIGLQHQNLGETTRGFTVTNKHLDFTIKYSKMKIQPAKMKEFTWIFIGGNNSPCRKMIYISNISQLGKVMHFTIV